METRGAKKNFRLPARLGAALDMLPQSEVFIDVGCDHGKLPLAALIEGKAKRVLALDISEASLAKAKALFAKSGLTAEFIHADGLAGLDCPDADSYALAICGMGGELIASILERGEAAAKGAKCVVMQPMGGEKELRAWLYANGYAITDENAVADVGRFYQLIAARYDPQGAIPYAEEALLEFGSVCYAKRQDALHRLLEKVQRSRIRRMERARRNGKIPENLVRGLEGVNRLLENWEGKNEAQ